MALPQRYRAPHGGSTTEPCTQSAQSGKVHPPVCLCKWPLCYAKSMPSSIAEKLCAFGFLGFLVWLCLSCCDRKPTCSALQSVKLIAAARARMHVRTLVRTFPKKVVPQNGCLGEVIVAFSFFFSDFSPSQGNQFSVVAFM